MNQAESLAHYLDNHSLAVQTRDGRVILRQGRGIMPLWTLACEEDVDLSGALVADKVIGLGAAVLMTKAGIADCYTPVISRAALGHLKSHCIECRCERIVDAIINRSGTGRCPLEALLDGTEPAQYIEAIGAFVRRLREQNDKST